VTYRGDETSIFEFSVKRRTHSDNDFEVVVGLGIHSFIATFAIEIESGTIAGVHRAGKTVLEMVHLVIRGDLVIVGRLDYRT
jgi:hypothetical protein